MSSYLLRQLLTKPELALTTLSQLPALSMPFIVSNPMPPGQVSLLGILVPYLSKVSRTDCCNSLCKNGEGNGKLKLQIKIEISFFLWSLNSRDLTGSDLIALGHKVVK